MSKTTINHLIINSPYTVPEIEKLRYTMQNKQYIGSNFDDFLKEEGLLPHAEAVAIKRVIAYQLEAEMKRAKVTKMEMAKKMRTSRSSLDRLLDPENASVSLLTLERAAVVLGRKLRIELA